ncbi:Uroporphyrinogen decarboxylase [Planctomycetes bacterium CA13]|uniref:Uroporphyrinogen decarboxylase n=1 Tax=Novipirellula herctigrandis TaxID=2527986 RepID=A0A5C5Z500_9BACT|nr:Uroporphyrinogen decarboxylase [Planctomycetes bacterium CA13]
MPETSENIHGIELVRAAFLGEKTARAPWVPFVGCHAAALIPMPTSDYLRSTEAMHKGLNLAISRYRPDGIPVAFDLQIEAETLGCGLNWAEETPPSVSSHPLVEGVTLGELQVPDVDAGRIPLVLEVARRLRAEHPDLALYGLITGPFTLALHLLGTDIFMRMFDDPEDVEKLLSFCSDVGVAMSSYYLDAGCDVIAVVDPMTSQIGPDQFAQFVTPYAKPVFDFIREKDALGSFFVCGHAQQNVESMCKTGAHNLCVDENIPLDFVRDVSRKHHVSFGGNLQLTTVLLLGKPEDAEKNAVQCLTIGENHGFVLAPGCDIAYDTPPENLEAIGKLVIDPYRQETVATLAETRSLDDIFDMSQYGLTDKVIVDIITLDSEACAPCQYMVEAVQKITPEFEGIVQWREHKIKYREEIVFMTSLMVKNVPTICIDGQITFVSQIPPRDELIAAIQKRINQKMRDRIQSQRASVYVLGDTEEACEPTRQQVDRAVMELGADVNVSVVTDEFEIRSFGIPLSQTPAIVTAKYRVQSTREVPEVAVIKEWIKSLQ